jgi:hypothetical protein
VSGHDIDPLTPELADFIARERSRPGLGTDAKSKLAARLAASGALAAAASALPSPPAQPTPAAPTAPGIATRVASAVVRRIVMGAAIFALGGASGAGLHAAFRHEPAPRVVVVTRTVERVVPAPVAATPSVPAPTPALPAPVPPHTSQLAPARAPAGHDSDLAAERALLEVARTALARGAHPDALASLNRHASQFPHGQLAEEREALAVQALVAAGRTDEAHRRAERFRQRYPNSMMEPAVEAALGSSQ